MSQHLTSLRGAGITDYDVVASGAYFSATLGCLMVINALLLTMSVLVIVMTEEEQRLNSTSLDIDWHLKLGGTGIGFSLLMVIVILWFAIGNYRWSKKNFTHQTLQAIATKA